MSVKMLIQVGGFLLLTAVSALPDASQFKGGLNILTDNDLTNQPDNKTAAVLLVDGELTLAEAGSSCSTLGESLYPQATISSLKNVWTYFSYSRKFTDNQQQFWLAQPPVASNSTSNSTATCRAISNRGSIVSVSCTEKLPVLCTQSAPPSNSTFADKSTRFQIAQPLAGNAKQVVVGFRDFHVFRFLGLRFAPQPKRFTYSTLFNESGTQQGLNYGSKCAQPPDVGTEDCLFVNVYTPLLPSNISQEELKPVMVWIHGGGFKTGSNQDVNHDGTNLASRGDVVVAQLNYRVGNLGFLAIDNTVTGNYGLQDLMTGLQWVKNNIASFGGDPDKVTIFGESAGAAAVRALLAAPRAEGLFIRAILQSTPGGLGGNRANTFYPPWSELANNTGTKVLKETGCANKTDKIACLRSYDAIKLSNLSSVATYPVNDGNILNSSGLVVNGSDGYTANVPIIIGFNRDEGGIFAPIPTNSNISQALSEISQRLDGNTSAVTSSGAFLPLGTTGNSTFQVLNLTARVITDANMRCDNQALAFSAARHRAFPSVYVYSFNRTYQSPGYSNFACDAPPTASRPLGDPDGEYLKCHAGEIIYTVGSLRRWRKDRDGLDTPFARLIVDYWSAFARTGDPNPEEEFLRARGYQSTLDQLEVNGGSWEPVNADRPQLRWLQWGEGEKMVGFQDVKQCEALGLPSNFFESPQRTRLVRRETSG